MLLLLLQCSLLQFYCWCLAGAVLAADGGEMINPRYLTNLPIHILKNTERRRLNLDLFKIIFPKFGRALAPPNHFKVLSWVTWSGSAPPKSSQSFVFGYSGHKSFQSFVLGYLVGLRPSKSSQSFVFGYSGYNPVG